MRVVENISVAVGDLGIPRALVLRGVRYGVSDRPTRWAGIGDSWDFGDREPENPGGLSLWRFQATPLSGGGESIVVDVASTPRGWILVGLVR